MFNQTKVYIIKFSFLLSIIQLSLAVYLLIQGYIELELYNYLFFYSIFLAFIPVIFGLIQFFTYTGQPFILNTHTNGFISKNAIKRDKSNQYHDLSIHLFGTGLMFIFYSIIVKIITPPIWIIAIAPLILSYVVFRNRTKRENVKF
jgi:hypothetical protein